jgi:hypothetical protein
MKLSEILDVENPPPAQPSPTTTSVAPVAPPQPPVVVVPDVSASANNDVSQDAVEARNNVRLMIAQGNQAVLEMLALAKDLKTPRAYEVAANLLKTMAELSQDLMAVHLQEATMIDPETTPSGNVNIGTAVFVGSTSDLQDMIKLKREEQKKLTIINPVSSNTP